MNLRPYQRRTVDEILPDLWRRGVSSVIVCAPVGSGKTVIATELARRTVEAGRSDLYFLAHRSELIEQPHHRFIAAGIAHGVVQAGRPASPEHRAQVASVQTVGRRGQRVLRGGDSCVVVIDECFPAGTLIDGKPIETFNVGDPILSFDHSINRVVTGTVTHIFKNVPSSLVKINTASGIQLVCTCSHPVYTEDGYKPASTLVRGEKIYVNQAQRVRCLQNDLHAEVVESNNDSNMFRAVQSKAQGGKEETHQCCMRSVRDWCSVRGEEVEASVERSDLLLNQMCQRLQGKRKRSYSCRVQSQPCFCENENKESDVRFSDTGEDARNVASERSCPNNQRRQWERTNTSAETSVRCSRKWMEAGTRCHNGRSALDYALAEPLQSGPGTSAAEDSYRSGRRISLYPRTKATRHQEDQVLAVDWVDSVEIQERGSNNGFGSLCPDGHVYNLEVAGTNTYFANGILVHNCHRVLSPQYLQVLKHFHDVYRRVYLVGLTATPYRLDGKPLGDVAQALVEIATPRQLIAEGYICNPTVYAGAQPDVRGVHRRAGDFVPEELEARACAPRLVADIVKTWKDKAEGLPTVGFALSIAHSQHLVERFRAAGVRAAHVDGTTPTAERSRTLARLAIGGLASSHPEALDIVINVGILVEGWDSESDYQRVLSDPSLWVDSEGRLTSYPPQYRPLCVLGDYAPTLSMCAYRQREGRVCRTHHDKSRAIVLSHSGNVVDDRGRVRHGWLEQHEGFSLETGMPVNAPETSLEGAKRLTPISPAYCPACMAVWPPGTRICGACGVEMVGQGGDDQVWREKAGELREVKPTSTERPATPYEQLTYLIQQYRTAQASGYKDFWAWKRYELRFGRMPDFGTDARARGEVGLPPRQRKGAKA